MTHFHLAYQPSALIRIASGSDTTTSNGFPSLFVEMQGRRLRLESKEPISSSIPVTVECDDAMFLGEVVAVVESNGRYQIEIAVEQVLSGLQSLMALRSQLLGENPSPLRNQYVQKGELAQVR